MFSLALTGIAGLISFSDTVDADAIIRSITGKLKHRGGAFIFRQNLDIGNVFLIQFYTEQADLKPIINSKKLFVLSGRVFNLKEALLEEFKPEKLRGYYVLAIANRKTLRIFRDRIGIQPVFYGYTKDFLVFASERRAIRDFVTPIRLPPGHMLLLQNRKVSIKPIRILTKPTPIEISEKEATETLSRLIIQSVERLSEDEIAVMFSGGLDSTTIARVASRFSDVRLFTVALPEARDSVWAKKVADVLKLPIDIHVIHPGDLEYYLEQTICVIDEWNPLKVLIGIPIYITCERIRENGFRVAFAGQGADELFGGYAKYLKMSIQDFLMNNFIDIITLAANNLERDEHISTFNGVELRLPYLDDDIVDFALRLPPELKIRNEIRKYILRLVAIRLGVPREIAFAPKKAVQYSTGTARYIRRIARRIGKSLSEYFRDVYTKICYGPTNAK